MPKYQVGFDYTISGIKYVTVEAESEDAAEAVAREKIIPMLDRPKGASMELDCADIMDG